ncbi:HEAT repeat domain-containing protein [bacterium]|nr:HEAT repeat domain-containing protein [bacterium]
MLHEFFKTGDDDSEEMNIPEPSQEELDELKSKIFKRLTEDIASDDEKKRYEALTLVPYFEADPRLSPYFTALFETTDISRKRDIIRAIGAWRHSDGVAMLINFLTNTHNQELLEQGLEEDVILALGEIGGLDALEFLINYATARYETHREQEDALGMASVEGITQIAMHGHDKALAFLVKNTEHPAWNLRESCANAFSVIYGGKEKIPKTVYDLLIRLSKDDNKDVRIAAYMSLDAIVGLDEANKKILNDARHKQIFGE